MNRTEFRKQTYMAPQCKAIKTEAGNFICTSVGLNSGGSTTQTGYDDKGEQNTGTIYFGDHSTVAPAKQGQDNLWEEE